MSVYGSHSTLRYTCIVKWLTCPMLHVSHLIGLFFSGKTLNIYVGDVTLAAILIPHHTTGFPDGLSNSVHWVLKGISLILYTHHRHQAGFGIHISQS